MIIPDSAIALLDEGLRLLPLSLPVSARTQLVNYLVLLSKWNAVHNLSAIRNVDEQVRLHLLDSLAVLPLIDHEYEQVADIGSGAGLPGVMFAIARPDWQVKLVESNRKKIAFLRELKRALCLDNVEVIGLRAEKWQPHKPIELIVSRAVASIDGFLSITEHLGSKESIWGLMKAHDDETCHSPGFIKTAVKKVQVPLLEAPRLWIEIQQEKLSR